MNLWNWDKPPFFPQLCKVSPAAAGRKIIPPMPSNSFFPCEKKRKRGEDTHNGEAITAEQGQSIYPLLYSAHSYACRPFSVNRSPRGATNKTVRTVRAHCTYAPGGDGEGEENSYCDLHRV